MKPYFYLYNMLLHTGVVAASPLWAALVASKAKYRAGFVRRFTGDVRANPDPKPGAVWYHAVSVGEVIASVPLVAEIERTFPQHDIHVSTVTATGQKTARSKLPTARTVFYFPFDTPPVVDRVIRTLKPSLFVTTETEIWPNVIWRLRKYGVPIVMVNGRISDDSFKWYRRFSFFFRDVLSCFSLFCMQSEQSARRIAAMGAPRERVLVTGNLKYDQPLKESVDAFTWRKKLGIDRDVPVVVAGSTHPGEEAFVLGAHAEWKRDHPDLRLVVAPRSPERFNEAANCIRSSGYPCFRYSLGPGNSNDTGSDAVVLLDTVGDLAEVYGIGNIGIVGGSFKAPGGHNPLEVAAYGIPVVFGSRMENFREIASVLTACGGGLEARDERELARIVSGLLDSPEEARARGRLALDALMAQRGAVGRTIEAIKTVLKP